MATTMYSLPKFLPAPTVDYENYDHEKVEADEQEHRKALQQYLKQANFNGKLTGEIVRFQIADGYAEYMVADAGRVWGLIHLPYGDAYQFPYIHKLSKTEIKKQIETDKKMAQLSVNA